MHIILLLGTDLQRITQPERIPLADADLSPMAILIDQVYLITVIS